MLLLPVQIDGHGRLLVTKLFLPAAFPAARPHRDEPGTRPFAYQVTLKLGLQFFCAATFGQSADVGWLAQLFPCVIHLS
jgi:hypothetical protein